MRKFSSRFFASFVIGILLSGTTHAVGENDCSTIKEAKRQEMCTYVCTPGCTVEINHEQGTVRAVGACSPKVHAIVRDAEMQVIQGASNPISGLPCVRVVAAPKPN